MNGFLQSITCGDRYEDDGDRLYRHDRVCGVYGDRERGCDG